MDHPKFGPRETSRPLKILVLATFFFSLFSALFNQVFPRFDLPTPEQLFGLSSWGVSHLFLWQFFTYFLIHPVTHGITFSFLLSLGFSLYLVWVVGSSIIERRGVSSFFSLYFSSGLFVGALLVTFQILGGISEPFSGNTPVLYAILMAWIMLYPEAQLFLLLAIPLKAKWLVLSILAANLFIDLSVGEWTYALSSAAGAFFGYLYALLFWKIRSPFVLLHPFEDAVLKILGAPQGRPHLHTSRAKIYDFKTGKAILTDEEFLEEMLSKISLHGKESLTWSERFRLRRISRRKKKNQEDNK